MSAEIFTGLSALRMVLETETDAGSPDNETTFAAIRKAIECLFLILLGTGVSGTVTAIAETVFTDTGNFVDSAHLEHTLVMTSGDAKGNMYTVDSNTVNALTCTGDTLVSDGVAIGDTYVILYDIKTNTGHTHNAKDGKNVDLADDSVESKHYAPNSVNQTALTNSAVGQAQLRTASGSVNDAGAGTRAQYSLPGGAYGFYPQFKSNSASAYAWYYEMWWNDGSSHALTTDYATYIVMEGPGTVIQYAQQTYVTASGEVHWIFIKIDKATGKRLGVWQAPDHPFLGNRGVMQPFAPFDPGKHEIIVVNPSLADVEETAISSIPKIGGGYMTKADLDKQTVEEDWLKPEKDFMDVFDEMFEIDEANEADWPDTPITIALPRIHKGRLISDWRFMPQQWFNPYTKKMEPVKVKPIKTVLQKPDYITTLKYRKR